MKVKDIIQLLEDQVPIKYAESFDNVGLLIGDNEQKVTNILVTLDTLESVVDEAIEKQCNLIISFHPIIFKGLKKIVGKNYVERVALKAIKNDIAIYSIHTALDNYHKGVNYMICKKLGLINQKILIPKKETIKKLSVYVPKDNSEEVRSAIFNAGGGSLGNYTKCSFSVLGTGSFKATALANPVIGKKGVFKENEEVQLQITFASHNELKVVKAMIATHPYEEIAYEISTLENINQEMGMGMIAELPIELSEKEAMQLVKTTFKTKGIRHSEFLNKKIKKIAVLGGSGSFAIDAAKAAGAQLFITSDIKYHEFYQAEKRLVIADIGHYESEQYTKNLIVSLLTEKISNFAPAYNSGNIILSDINTNPIKYF